MQPTARIILDEMQLVLYDGELSVGFGEGFYAVPIRWLWEGW